MAWMLAHCVWLPLKSEFFGRFCGTTFGAFPLKSEFFGRFCGTTFGA